MCQIILTQTGMENGNKKKHGRPRKVILPPSLTENDFSSVNCTQINDDPNETIDENTQNKEQMGTLNQSVTIG